MSRMSRKPSWFLELLQVLGALAAMSLVFFLVWLVLFVVLSLLIFLVLSVTTPWNFLIRLLTSLSGAFLFLKLGMLVLTMMDLLPVTWEKKQEPDVECPYCGKTLRTPRAQQCQHCHQHWHEVPEEEIAQLRAQRKEKLSWKIRSE